MSDISCTIGDTVPPNVAKMWGWGIMKIMNFDETKLAAAQGDSQAQFVLGDMYDNGYGVPQDKQEAVRWFQKAARQDNVHALCCLGMMYKYGIVVQKDYEIAGSCYKKAAQSGYAYAQYKLAWMYRDARKDRRQMFYWFEKAAEQGHADAQFQLGYIYGRGIGISQDEQKREYWYEKAAAQDHAKAQYALRNTREREYWYEEAFEQGHAKARYAPKKRWKYVAKKNHPNKEIQSLQEAAAQGVADAQNELGLKYESGDGVEKDYPKAEELYKKAAEQGYADAQYNFARMIEPRDKIEAMRWYEKAAQQAHSAATEAYVKGYDC